MNKLSILASALLLAFGGNAFAASISSLGDVPASSQLINFESEDGLVIGTGGNWSNLGLSFMANDQFTVGQNVADLGENGLWGANGNHFLSFDKIGSMALTIDFGGLTTRGFGFDYSIYETDPASASLTVTAFDAGNNVVGTFDKTFAAFGSSTYNQFMTAGWVEASPSIARVVIQGDGVVLDNFTFTTPVPEPKTYAMLLAGLGMIGFAARRNKR